MMFSAWIEIALTFSLCACVLAPEVLLPSNSSLSKEKSLHENADDETRNHKGDVQFDTANNVREEYQLPKKETIQPKTKAAFHSTNPQEGTRNDNELLIQKESVEDELQGGPFSPASSEELFDINVLPPPAVEEDLIDLTTTKTTGSSSGPLDTKTPDEIPNPIKIDKPVELEVGRIQSFEEWKKYQIQSQEDTVATETHPPSHRTPRAKEMQMNYASQDCGAKVLTHNPEAKHVGAILDENKDLYLLNPCSEQIWFVVELCEPIQVHQIQLANLELFSSMPHKFHVWISEWFPAREWRLLDTFEAENERAIQTFSPKRDQIMFAKYMKFEMKSHFGNEHFCPLTLTRVFGVSMVEEYDDDVEEKTTTEDENELKSNDQAASENAKTEEIDSAEILSDEPTRPSEHDMESGSIGKMFDIVKNAVGNLLGKNAPTTNNEASATTSNPDEPSIQEDSFDPAWESSVTLVTNRSEVEMSTSSSVKPPLVTLIETGDGQDIVPFPQSSTPLYSLKFLSSLSDVNFSVKFCWFLEFLYRVSMLSCIVQPYGNYTSGYEAFPPIIYEKYSKQSTSSEGSTKPLVLENNTKQAQIPGLNVVEEKSQQHEEEKQDAEYPLSQVEATFLEKTVLDSSTLRNRLSPTALDQKDKNEINDFVVKENIFTDESVKFMNGALKVDNFDESDELTTLDTDPPSSVHNSLNVEHQLVSEGEELVVSEEDAKEKFQFSNFKDTKTDIRLAQDFNGLNNPPRLNSEDVNPLQSDVSKDLSEYSEEISIHIDGMSSSMQQQESKTVDILPASNGPSPSDDDARTIHSTFEENASKAESIAPIEEHGPVNPGTGQKESVLVRMNNRIRTLEKNVSLSSAYLENLSQRFKRQTDEMQRVFHQTEKRLDETSQALEESKKNAHNVTSIEKNNTQMFRKEMKDLADAFDYLNNCMIARHLCLMAIEAVCFVVICVTCFGFRQIRLTRRLVKVEREVEGLLLHKSKICNGGSDHCLGKNKLHSKKSRFSNFLKSPEESLPDCSATNTSSIRSRPLPTSKSLCSMPQRKRSGISLNASPKGKVECHGKAQTSNDRTSSAEHWWPQYFRGNQRATKWKKKHSKAINQNAQSNQPPYSALASNHLFSTSACGSTALSWQNRLLAVFPGKER